MSNLTPKIQKLIDRADATNVSHITDGKKNGLLCIRLDWDSGFIRNNAEGQFEVFKEAQPSTFEELIASGASELLVHWRNSIEGKTIKHTYHIETDKVDIAELLVNNNLGGVISNDVSIIRTAIDNLNPNLPADFWTMCEIDTTTITNDSCVVKVIDQGVEYVGQVIVTFNILIDIATLITNTDLGNFDSFVSEAVIFAKVNELNPNLPSDLMNDVYIPNFTTTHCSIMAKATSEKYIGSVECSYTSPLMTLTPDTQDAFPPGVVYIYFDTKLPDDAILVSSDPNFNYSLSTDRRNASVAGSNYVHSFDVTASLNEVYISNTVHVNYISNDPYATLKAFNITLGDGSIVSFDGVNKFNLIYTQAPLVFIQINQSIFNQMFDNNIDIETPGALDDFSLSIYDDPNENDTFTVANQGGAQMQFIVGGNPGTINDAVVMQNTFWKNNISYKIGNVDIGRLYTITVSSHASTSTSSIKKTSKGAIYNDDKLDCIEIKAKVGAFAYGNQTSFNDANTITSEASYNDFNAIRNEPSFTLIFEEENFVNGFDFESTLLSLFAFPTITGMKLYQANVLRRTKLKNRNGQRPIVNYEVEFTHISNKIQQSGKSIEEYVHLSVNGSGYVWPIVDNSSGKISVNANRLQHTGITHITENFYNACIQSSSVLFGWEIIDENDDNEGNGTISQPANIDGEVDENGALIYTYRVYNPKILFPVGFQSAPSNILNRQTTPVSNISFIQNIDFAYQEYQSWKEQTEQQITGDYDEKYIGEFSWTAGGAIDNIHELSTTTFNSYKITTAINGYIEIERKPGETSNQLDVIGMNWNDINAFNSLINCDIITLPFSFEDRISYLAKDWAYVGGIMNVISGGIPFGYTNIIKDTKGDFYYNINGLVSSFFLNFARQEFGSETNSGFLNRFFGKNGDKLDAKNSAMVLKYNLTDRFKIDDTLTIDTAVLGQQYNFGNSQGSSKFDLTDMNKTIKLKVYYDSNLSAYVGSHAVDDGTVKKYIICCYKNANFGASSIKLSFENFFLSNSKVFQGAYQTQSEYTQSSREWTNVIPFNYFNQIGFDTLNGNKMEFPVNPLPNPNYSYIQYESTVDVSNLAYSFFDRYNQIVNLESYSNHGWSESVSGGRQIADKNIGEVKSANNQIITFVNQNWVAETTTGQAIEDIKKNYSGFRIMAHLTNYGKIGNRELIFGVPDGNWKYQDKTNDNIKEIRFDIFNSQTQTIPYNIATQNNIITGSNYGYAVDGNDTIDCALSITWSANMIHNESTDSYDLQIAFTFNNKVNSIKVDRIRSDTTENGLWFYSYATSVALTEQYTLESLRFDLRFDSFTPILAFQEIKKKV